MPCHFDGLGVLLASGLGTCLRSTAAEEGTVMAHGHDSCWEHPSYFNGDRNGSGCGAFGRSGRSFRRNLLEVRPFNDTNMDQNSKSWFERVGCQVSSWVSDVAAHPYAQIGVIIFCALWWTVGLPTDILTAALSILAITLTQMVLNRQGEREVDAHRRDVAMHAKLDELVVSVRGARNEMAGIEELDEEDIAELKEEMKEAIEESGVAESDPKAKEVAKDAVDAGIADARRTVSKRHDAKKR